MAYVKQTITNGETITSTWGNLIQTQYDEVATELANKDGALWTQIEIAQPTLPASVTIYAHQNLGGF